MIETKPYVVGQLVELRNAHLHNTKDHVEQAQIVKVFSELSARADKIARSNSIDAITNNWYTQDFEDKKINVYRISANEDEKLCSVCAAANGLMLAAELRAPGYTAPPFHHNCRCDGDMWSTVDNISELLTWLVPGKDAADTYWVVSADDLLCLGWSGVTSEMVAALTEVQYKYDILTVERVKHFLAQCSKETNKGAWLREQEYVDWPSQQAYESYFNNNKSYKYLYRGSGYIQTTWIYNYYSYATYLIVSAYPDIDVDVKYSSNNDTATLRKLYEKAVAIAEERGYDISKFTAVVNQGADYVAANYAWDVAGFWWMAASANERVDTLKKRTASEVDKITDTVNGGEGSNARKDRIDYYDELDKYLGK